MHPVLIHFLGGRIRDLGKGAFGMWALIAHGGLSKPTVRTEPLNLFRASKNMGGHFSEEKKGPAATCPEAQGFQKYRGHFSGNKKRLRQRSQPLRASKKSGTIFQKYFVQKPAKPATDLSHNGHQKSIWSKSHSGYCFRLPLA